MISSSDNLLLDTAENNKIVTKGLAYQVSKCLKKNYFDLIININL
jgi:hypothetical protein